MKSRKSSHFFFELLKAFSFVCVIFSSCASCQKDKGYYAVLLKNKVGEKQANTVNLKGVPDGFYSFPLNEKEGVILKITDRSITGYLDKNGFLLQFNQLTSTSSSGYFCEGFICRCQSDDGLDCDKMLDETGCILIKDEDGITYCLRFPIFQKSSKVKITPVINPQIIGKYESRKIKLIYIDNRMGFIIDSISKMGYLYLLKDRDLVKYSFDGNTVKSIPLAKSLDKIYEEEVSDFKNEVQGLKILELNCDEIRALDSYSAKCRREMCKTWNCITSFGSECDCEGGNTTDGCLRTTCFYCFALNDCPQKTTIKSYDANIKILTSVETN